MGIKYLDSEKSTGGIKYLDEEQSEGSEGNVKLTEDDKIPFPPANTFLGRTLDDLVTRPAIDLARGFREGSADVVAPGAAVMSAIGIPDELNVLKTIKDENLREAERLPDSGAPFISKAAFGLLGRAPGLTAEFMQAGALLKGAGIAQAIPRMLGIEASSKAAQSLNIAAEIGVVDALVDLDKGISQSIESGLQGTTIGLAIPVTAQLFKNGAKLAAEFGVGVGKKLLAIAGVPQETADAFLKDPKRFNLNLFKKEESVRNIQQRNKDSLIKLQENQRAQRDLVREKHINSREQLRDRSRQELEKLRNVEKGITGETLRKGQVKSDQLERTLNAQREATTKSLNDNLHNDISQSMESLRLVREERGQRVGHAIENLLDDKPFTAIDANPVLQAFDDVIKLKNSPITVGIGKNAQVANKVAGENVSFANDINLKRQQLLSRSKSGKVTISFLQDLKRSFQSLAKQKGIARTDVEVQYAKFAESMNLVNVMEKNPAIKKQVGEKAANEIAAANKQFKEIAESHAKAIANIAKKDATGKFVPDINKIASGVRSKNPQVIKELNEIDALLPKGSKIFPSVNEHVTNLKQLSLSEKAALNALKRTNSAEMDLVKEAQRKLERNLNIRQTAKKQKVTQQQRKEISELFNNKTNELQEAHRRITDEETFIKDRELLQGSQQVGIRAITGTTAPVTAKAFKIANAISESQFGQGVSQFSDDILNIIDSEIAKKAISAKAR